MKSYEQIAKDLLERRDRFDAERQRKEKRGRNVVVSVFCVCLIVLTGIGVWQSSRFRPEPIRTVEESAVIETDFSDDVDTGDQMLQADRNNKIVVHPISGEAVGKMNICLRIEDFVAMSHDEMEQYYGVDYLPVVPPDLKAWENQRSGLYMRDGGTGEVYFDVDILNYSTEDFTRFLHLEVSKNRIPFSDCLFDGTEEKSVVNNVEVLIGRTESGYYSEFMYHDVEFIMNAKGLSEEEFVAVISSIVD